MIARVYSVYDSKAEAYLQPFFMQSRGVAIRAFTDCVNDPKHQWGAHPEDYTLFELATFDDGDGVFEVYATPHSVGLGTEFVRVNE